MRIHGTVDIRARVQFLPFLQLRAHPRHHVRLLRSEVVFLGGVLAEVEQLDMKIEGSKLIYRAKLKVSFKYHGED